MACQWRCQWASAAANPFLSFIANHAVVVGRLTNSPAGKSRRLAGGEDSCSACSLSRWDSGGSCWLTVKQQMTSLVEEDACGDAAVVCAANNSSPHRRRSRRAVSCFYATDRHLACPLVCLTCLESLCFHVMSVAVAAPSQGPSDERSPACAPTSAQGQPLHLSLSLA